MKAALWIRISAVLLLLFAVGHTAGFLSFRPADPAAQAVWSAMGTRFVERGATFSYAGFYRGFGLSISVSQLFLAWLAFLLVGVARRDPVTARRILWSLVLLQAAGFVLSLLYFSVIPAVLSVVCGVTLALAALSVGRERAASV